MIEIKNLSVNFGEKSILENINFTIPDNGIVSIVGKSGSGKSVLIKSIIGLIDSFEGEILIDSHHFYDKNQNAKISMLFQNSALLDSMNTFYNVALPLVEHTKLSTKLIREKVIETLHLVGLEGIEHESISNLSGGMRKRVALARAIIQEPKYILFDEPTTGLDPIIATEIVNLIIRLQKDIGFCAVIITHDIRFLQKLSGKVIMIRDKALYFEGDVESFIHSQNKNIKFFVDSY